MRATAAPEGDNRVRLSVALDEAEVDDALDGVVRRLARQVRVPGFRPGKVPRKVLEARMGGAAALRGEALREALPDFYARAVVDTEIDPIAAPAIDITGGDDAGPVTFDAVVEVRPTVAIPGYAGLVVTVPSLDVPDDEVAAQLDRMRATSGELVEVDRPAQAGDRVTIGIVGTRRSADGDAAGADDDLQVDDLVYEVGSGSVVPELDDQLVGARSGDTRTFTAEIGSPSTTVEFTVSVGQVQELVLPEMDDAWAAEASEFDTVDELVADVTDRIRRMRVLQARLALRERALDALVALVTDEIPAVLVEDELRERLHELGHQLERQGMDVAAFLAATGRDEAAFVAELREAAQRNVTADLALRALADAESIEVTDEELDEELSATAARLGIPAAAARAELERAGRLATVRSDQRTAKALRWLVDHVDVVDEEGNPVARDLLDGGTEGGGDEEPVDGGPGEENGA
jgi:trigger factor